VTLSFVPWRLLRVCVFAVLLLVCGDTFAWGNLGHRITAEVADALLTSSAHRQVEQLLDDESLSDAAVFMDVHRDELREHWPDSPRWHYDNRPVCSGHANYCRDGNCATSQLIRLQRILVDKQSTRAERALALRLVVHMLGDIHQPLHMSDNDDRGGNDVFVRLYAGSERRRLHEVFDTQLVQQAAQGRSAHRYAVELLNRYRAQQAMWQQGTITDWAQESHWLGTKDIYSPLPNFACTQVDSRTITLPQSYVDHARKMVSEQLAKAGMRIAALLNATFK